MMLAFIIFFVACYLYWKWHTRRQAGEPPELPGSLPFIGHAHLLIGNTFTVSPLLFLFCWMEYRYRFAPTFSIFVPSYKAMAIMIGTYSIESTRDGSSGERSRAIRTWDAQLPLKLKIRFWNFVKDSSYKCMELGHVSSYHTGPFKFYVLTDPDDIYTVSNACFQKDEFSYEFTKQLLGDGLLFSPVSTWKRHRKLISPAFNQQILDSFMEIFNRQGRQLVKNMEVEIGNGWFDQTKYVRQNFMETICLTALDDDITPEEAVDYVEAFENYMNGNILRFQKIWLHSDFIFRFSNLKKRLDASIKILHEMSDKVLKKKRSLRKINGTEVNKEKSPKVKVFMDLLMDLDDGVLTDQEIRDEMNTIIMAGHDTSANVIVFTLILIGSYPEVQKKIFKELDDIFGGSDRDVEKQDLSKLTYVEAVLKESMRFYVMAPFVGRHIDREVKLKTCTLKPGNNCMFLYYGLHRHPIWGPDANDFKPERWLDPATLPKNPNAFAGFSLGKRNCIGKAYAMMSMKTTICFLFRRYKLHADHNQLELKLDVLLKPVSGHYITIEDRNKL